MSDFDGKEPDLFVKKLIHQFMNDQLGDLQGDKQDNNNSFIFLEKSTLNMLMVYLLLNGERQIPLNETEDYNGISQTQILELLEQIQLEQKNEFEALISFIKEKL